MEDQVETSIHLGTGTKGLVGAKLFQRGIRTIQNIHVI
jgi:hypothetical protein